MAAHGYKIHKIPVNMSPLNLVGVDSYGGYFLCDVFSNGVRIACFPKMTRGQAKAQQIVAYCFIPFNRPYRLNTIFTRLRFHMHVFRYSF